MPGGKCVFNYSWLKEDNFSQWLAAVKDDKYSAHCKICRRKFSIASMGKSALKSHMDGKIHQKLLQDQRNPINYFLVNSTSVTPCLSRDTSKAHDGPSQSKEKQSVLSKQVADAHDTSASTSTIGPSQSKEKQSSFHHLSTLSKQVAEILWVLNCVDSHFSAASNVGINTLFKMMFCDSEIASLYSMSESKYC